jgi:hypothetical protein
VPSATLVALLDSTADGPGWARAWIDDVLGQHLPGWSREAGNPIALRGWSVGAVFGNEPLVQSRPIVRARDVEPLDDLLRTPAGCIVAAFASHDTRGSEITAKPPPCRISRFRRWVGTRAEAELPAELSRALREDLPEFLSRHRIDRTDGELVFLTFLSELHRAGGLGSAYDPPDRIHRALAALEARLPTVAPHNLMVSDGRTFAMLHREGTLLAFDAPSDAPRPRVGLSSTGGRGPAAKLLLYLPGAGPDAPVAGAEKIADGRLTIEARRPWSMQRA